MGSRRRRRKPNGSSVAKGMLDGILYALRARPLSDLSRNEGIKTYSPQGIDGDDAVVMLAQLYDADLSADGDIGVQPPLDCITRFLH